MGLRENGLSPLSNFDCESCFSPLKLARGGVCPTQIIGHRFFWIAHNISPPYSYFHLMAITERPNPFSDVAMASARNRTWPFDCLGDTNCLPLAGDHRSASTCIIKTWKCSAVYWDKCTKSRTGFFLMSDAGKLKSHLTRTHGTLQNKADHLKPKRKSFFSTFYRPASYPASGVAWRSSPQNISFASSKKCRSTSTWQKLSGPRFEFFAFGFCSGLVEILGAIWVYWEWPPKMII